MTLLTILHNDMYPNNLILRRMDCSSTALAAINSLKKQDTLCIASSFQYNIALVLNSANLAYIMRVTRRRTLRPSLYDHAIDKTSIFDGLGVIFERAVGECGSDCVRSGTVLWARAVVQLAIVSVSLMRMRINWHTRWWNSWGLARYASSSSYTPSYKKHSRIKK